MKNAFLHDDLEEDVYMDRPPAFETKAFENKVCKLKKALYRFKQSPRAWFGRFTKSMLKRGYHQSQGDHALFIKHSTNRKVTAVIVYVDDIIFIGSDLQEMTNLKSYLAQSLELQT